jgi:hypothetical protein
MNRWLLRVFGLGAWANGAWDFNAYFVHGEIIPFLHTWLVLLPIFAIFFGYPIVGLFLIFGKMPHRTSLPQGLEEIETVLETALETELESVAPL